MAIAEHSSHLRGNLKRFSTTPKSQATFSTSFNNHCRHLRDGLEILSTFITFISFDNIPTNITVTAIENLETGHNLWRRRCHCSGIKHLTPAAHSLCKYTQEIILFRILISKRRLGPDIWPEIANQAKSTQDIMRRVQSKEVHYQRKASGSKTCALSPFGKKARHVSLLTS